MAPIIIFPTLLLAIQTGGAGGAVDLPGFPQVRASSTSCSRGR